MKIDFGAACKDLFSTPNKWNTVLGMVVCILIPVAGPLVTMGYLLRRFSRERSGLGKEDFEFSYFSEYLMAGVWPFLATMVFSLCLMPLAFLAEIPILGAIFVAEENEGLAIVLGIVGFLLYFLAIILMNLLVFPVMLRSGLMMDFKGGFSKTFILSFIKKVGGSLFLWFALIMIAAYPLSIIGMLALFVGFLFIAVCMQFVMFHILFQHYDLYLERGGEPITINPNLIKELGTARAGSLPPPMPPR